MVELTPRSECVYTHHLDLCHATNGVLTSQPPDHAKIGMRVKTAQQNFACLHGLRRKLVNMDTIFSQGPL